MQIHILASGSTGNAIYLNMGNTHLLVDAGISTRRVERGLAELGVRVSDLDGVLITHEHQDHIRGLEVLLKKYRLPVYTRRATWEAIPGWQAFPQESWRRVTREFSIKDVDVETFRISHDAADPVGFCFYHARRKWVIATDLGVINPAAEKALAWADLVVLEANHDLDMLANGPYPRFLKQRILGQQGHLSNLAAGEVLGRIPRRDRMEVFLAHLSQHNNRPELARETVSKLLGDKGCQVGEEVALHLTYPDQRCGLCLTR